MGLAFCYKLWYVLHFTCQCWNPRNILLLTFVHTIRFLTFIQNFSPLSFWLTQIPRLILQKQRYRWRWTISKDFFADIKETDVNCTVMNRKEDSEGGGSLVVLIVLEKIVELTWREDEERRRLTAGTHLYTSCINWGTIRVKPLPKKTT